jgi:hypothetical protein
VEAYAIVVVAHMQWFLRAASNFSEYVAEKNNYITNLENRTKRDRVPEGCGAQLVQSD